MRIYRIQNKTNGYGPWSDSEDRTGKEDLPRYYSSDDIYNEKRVSGPYCGHGPVPYEDGVHDHKNWTYVDGGDDEENPVLCGTQSLTQIKWWFSCRVGRKAIMERCEGVIMEVPDDKVAVGGSQCCFRKDDATICGSFDLETLTEMDHA